MEEQPVTTQQKVHDLTDDLDQNGLNYIIGVPNGLSADKQISLSEDSKPSYDEKKLLF